MFDVFLVTTVVERVAFEVLVNVVVVGLAAVVDIVEEDGVFTVVDGPTVVRLLTVLVVVSVFVETIEVALEVVVTV